jgi:hypothetical protein
MDAFRYGCFVTERHCWNEWGYVLIVHATLTYLYINLTLAESEPFLLLLRIYLCQRHDLQLLDVIVSCPENLHRNLVLRVEASQASNLIHEGNRILFSRQQIVKMKVAARFRTKM